MLIQLNSLRRHYKSNRCLFLAIFKMIRLLFPVPQLRARYDTVNVTKQQLGFFFALPNRRSYTMFAHRWRR